MRPTRRFRPRIFADLASDSGSPSSQVLELLPFRLVHTHRCRSSRRRDSFDTRLQEKRSSKAFRIVAQRMARSAVPRFGVRAQQALVQLGPTKSLSAR